MPVALSYRDTEQILRRLRGLEERLVLVGGQAVNFWAERYRNRVPELAAMGPLTSQDIDFCGNDTGIRFRVLHPVRCMESRVHNVLGLPGYRNPHALVQLKASIFCAREFLRDLVGEGYVRPALKLNERIFRFCLKDMHGSVVHREIDADPFDAVLVDGMPDEFRSRRYPQMIDALRRKRRSPSQ